MSHVVHAVQHEVEHRIEHEHGHEHGGGHATKSAQSQNKKIALLIAVLALFLAISETLGKSAQTAGLELYIKASNSWNFFQAKTVRQTTLRTAAEAMAIEVGARPDAAFKAAMSEQIAAWKETVKRYDSDPKEQDGRKEIRARAEQFERESNAAFARYHNYELASAAYQIGIVLASAAVITGMMALAYGAAGVGLIGLTFAALGLLAPDALHDLLHHATHWFAHFFQAAGAH
jgi:hypothetical protein